MNAPETTATPAPSPATAPADDVLWYQDAVIYQLHIKAFFRITSYNVCYTKLLRFDYFL